MVKANSLKPMSVVMELGDGSLHWYVAGGAATVGGGDGDDEGDDEDAPRSSSTGSMRLVLLTTIDT